MIGWERHIYSTIRTRRSAIDEDYKICIIFSVLTGIYVSHDVPARNIVLAAIKKLRGNRITLLMHVLYIEKMGPTITYVGTTANWCMFERGVLFDQIFSVLLKSAKYLCV